jgi:hypothetical protein
LAHFLEDEAGIRLCHVQSRDVIIDVLAPAYSAEVEWSSAPSWSPDGQAVAWSTDYEDGAHHLFVYDLDTEQVTRIVDDLPAVIDIRPQVLWGHSGILVVIDDSVAENVVAPLYSPSGDRLQENLAPSQSYLVYFWATDEAGKEYLGAYLHYVSGWFVDPETGVSLLLFGEIHMVSSFAPDGLALVMDYDDYTWQARLPDGEMVNINGLDPNLIDFLPWRHFQPLNVSIAPDGEAFAVFERVQFVWRDGEVTEVPDSIPGGDGTGVIWTPMVYRIHGEMFSGAG